MSGEEGRGNLLSLRYTGGLKRYVSLHRGKGVKNDRKCHYVIFKRYLGDVLGISCSTYVLGVDGPIY